MRSFIRWTNLVVSNCYRFTLTFLAIVLLAGCGPKETGEPASGGPGGQETASATPSATESAYPATATTPASTTMASMNAQEFLSKASDATVDWPGHPDWKYVDVRDGSLALPRLSTLAGQPIWAEP